MLRIKYDNDVWLVLAEGVSRDGKTFCHLASTTRFRQQKNGAVPVQIGDWIDQRLLLSAAIEQEEQQRAEYYARYGDGGLGPHNNPEN